MSKSVDAFRTIGEVADELNVPKHVLRFWEGKFPHIRPMKRGGGRRYYRPEDMELLRGIRHLLHAEGYTIKGVQKILREQGIDSVKAASAAGEAAAAKDSRASRSRGKAQVSAKAGAAPAAASAKPAEDSGQPMGSKEKAPAAAKATPRKDVVAAAIRELEICRQLLRPRASKPAEGASPRLRAARS